MTCAPTATRTRDLPLRRSFHVPGSTATSLVYAGFLIVWLLLDTCGFRPVLARTWHGCALAPSADPLVRNLGYWTCWMLCDLDEH
jgi:hypothetical protein